jgi:hypothetical protein
MTLAIVNFQRLGLGIRCPVKSRSRLKDMNFYD